MPTPIRITASKDEAGFPKRNWDFHAPWINQNAYWNASGVFQQEELSKLLSSRVIEYDIKFKYSIPHYNFDDYRDQHEWEHATESFEKDIEYSCSGE